MAQSVNELKLTNTEVYSEMTNTSLCSFFTTDKSN